MTNEDSSPKTNVDAAEPAAGSIIADRYRLTSRLGSGGMGAVFRGEHLALKKPVAVKFLHRFASGDTEMVARFEREAQTAARIDHPHIAKAIDFGKLPDGTLYLVMEYVEGPTLTAVLAQSPRLAPPRALKIASEIGGALERAHALGIVHRDIKPDNVVLCDRDGDSDFVKVIDFGIARTSNASTNLTQMGTVFGTPGYLSPEQALGQQVDAAADQYALGIVIFQMLTGRMPYSAPDAISLLQQHIMAPIPHASEIAPELPRGVDDVLTRMLAKRAHERFPSMTAAIDALRVAIESPTTAGAMPAGLAATVANRPAVTPASWSGGPSQANAPAPPASGSWAGAPQQPSPSSWAGTPPNAPQSPSSWAGSPPPAGPHPAASWAGGPPAHASTQQLATPSPAAAPGGPTRSRIVPIVVITVLAIVGVAVALHLRGGDEHVSTNQVTDTTATNAPQHPTPQHPTPQTPVPQTPIANNHPTPTTVANNNPAPSPDAAADASTAEPQVVGTSSRNCADGHCACRNTLACSYSCGTEPCEATCERMRSCRGSCGDHCQQTCRDGQQCNLTCGDDCQVTSRNVHDTRVSCGEHCAVNCSLMMGCTVRMKSGDVTCGERTGRCDVQCQLPDGHWAFATRCARGQYHCPPGPCGDS